MSLCTLTISLFKIQKGLFHINAPAEPGEFSFVADHAVAWNDNGDGISGICLPHSTARFWTSNIFGQLAV